MQKAHEKTSRVVVVARYSPLSPRSFKKTSKRMQRRRIPMTTCCPFKAQMARMMKRMAVVMRDKIVVRIRMRHRISLTAFDFSGSYSCCVRDTTVNYRIT